MSRICVKNLPKHVAEDRLRDFFSQRGEVTDAKIVRTRDGKSRQFAFIGYRTEQEANEAMKYFNKSYLDTSRIICEIARKVGDPDTPRPWSRYSSQKHDNNSTETGEKKAGVKGSTLGKKEIENGSENDDLKLQEFLQLMQPRVKSKMWANDIVLDAPERQNSKVIIEKKGRRTSVTADVDSSDIALDENETKASNSVARNEFISDMDYFNSRVKKDWSDSESDDDEDNDDDDEKGKENSVSENVVIQDQVQEDSSKDLDGEILDKDDSNEVLQTGRLFVRNLPYTATEDELTELFSKFGDLSQVHIVIDKDTMRSKGFAYVLFKVPECAVSALEQVDKSIFQGRLLHVMTAKLKKSADRPEFGDLANQGAKSLKQKREEERKAAEAGGDTRAWNSLFMRPDTIVENIARKYGVNKSELLDREADDLCVRIALGETQVISETKKSLTNAGVNISSLEEIAAGKTDGIKRSNHVLLVKNLPYGSSDGELARLFGKFGSLDKIIIPPTKTLALVVFLEPSQARAAFKGLAYKRYKDAPLFLEWAPDNVLNKGSVSEGDKKNDTAVGQHGVKRAILEQHVEGISYADIDPDRNESRSLYVKNLNFKTTEESLKNHFSELVKEGKLKSIGIIRVKGHLKSGKQVSKGYGFIEFDSVETATNVCKNLQGTILDGHALILQLCHAKKEEQAAKNVDKDTSSTKLLVRNVAFEATKKDLRQLFSPFGQIKSVRLPISMKFGTHRGFAFVEFVTKQEAQNALQALSSTHLYGRHLVLERAKEGESLEELRTRTAAQFTNEENIVENIARKYGVNKSELLDREADDLCVRIALGETQVISETKKSLTNAGVNISSLEEIAAGKTDGIKRSNHVLLVKNLPYGSSDGELARLFGKFGSLDKIIIPPTKTLALVVFLEPSQARAAFKGLAYKRYKDAPLFLEWAPDNVLNKGSVSEGDKKNDTAVGQHGVKRAILEQHVEGISYADIDPDRNESRSLYVKNLNFKTTEESLKNHFSELVKEGKLKSIGIIRVKGHLKSGKQVSKGYGFIEFDSVETATNVCKNLQGTILDGHALILQLCHAKKEEQAAKNVDKDTSSTKLLVRNVAFEATKKDLRQLFSPFGQIKSVRLPISMKFGTHRGFAFVEFVTKQEAQNALQALSSTHLYGRHLVLERAKEGESLEELRTRTAAQFTNEENVYRNPSRLSKKRKNTDIFDDGRKKFGKLSD